MRRRRRNVSSASQSPRRAVSGAGAAFALQQVFDPGIEHVLRAERDAAAEEVDPSGGEDGEPALETLQAELCALLTSSPVELESIRNVLRAAAREGHDWRLLYEEAARAVIAERPYLAPGIPLAARVAPRGQCDESR